MNWVLICFHPGERRITTLRFNTHLAAENAAMWLKKMFGDNIEFTIMEDFQTTHYLEDEPHVR